MKTMQLGQKSKDKITGFEGVLTGKASYLTGCDQYLVQPAVKDGNFREGKWFDEGRLEVVGEAFTAADVAADKNGCDTTAPVK